MKISIVIPNYQGGKFLESAIQSVLLQAYPDFELIIIDGASQDDSLEIIKKYEESIAYWVSEPDNGQSDAINKGFAHATGEVLTFLGSDDYYLPGTFLDVAAQYRRNPGVGAIIGGFCFMDADYDRQGYPILPFIDGATPVDLTLGPPGKYRLHQVATFYTRLALDSVGRTVCEEMHFVMDRELLYRVCRQYPLVLSQRVYGVFRHHPESKSMAEILPFAREFAGLYLSALSGEHNQDRMRKKMAQYRLSRGYMKYAGAIRRFPESLLALVCAGLHYPSLFLSTSYWKQHLQLVNGWDRKIFQEH